MIQKTSVFLKRQLGRISGELPRNVSELDSYVDSIISIYGLPDQPDYKKAIIKAVHGVSQATHKAPKYFFYVHMRRHEAMMAAVKKICELEKIEKQAATPKPELLLGQSPQTPTS